jgi:hypothetical protein
MRAGKDATIIAIPSTNPISGERKMNRTGFRTQDFPRREPSFPKKPEQHTLYFSTYTKKRVECQLLQMKDQAR